MHVLAEQLRNGRTGGRHGGLAFLVCWLAACSGDPKVAPVPQRARPVVHATSYPLWFMVSRLGGEWIEATCVAPAGVELRHWRPSREDLRLLQSADLVFVNGAGLEPWLSQANLAPQRLVDASRGVTKHLIVVGGVVHTHGGQTHSHDGRDPFYWLDPTLAAGQVAPVRDALVTLLPQHRDAVMDRAKKLEQELLALANELRAAAAARSVVSTESCYAYLARSGFARVVSLDLNGSSDVDDATVAAARQKVGADGAGAEVSLILSPQPLPAALEQRLAQAFSAPLVVFEIASTLGFERQQRGEDYISILRANIARLR